MPRDENGIDIKLFDRRVVERNIKKGVITRKDYDRHLKSLPDAKANVIPPDEPVADVDADDKE